MEVKNKEPKLCIGDKVSHNIWPLGAIARWQERNRIRRAELGAGPIAFYVCYAADRIILGLDKEESGRVTDMWIWAPLLLIMIGLPMILFRASQRLGNFIWYGE